MTKQDLIDALFAGIEKSDAEKSDTVTISKGTASEILSMLIRIHDHVQSRIEKDGKVLFYCADCGKSFFADPREDPECFERWHYHRWYATCPQCHADVTQNDRYWR